MTMSHADWVGAAEEEYRRLGTLLAELDDEDWHRPTDCTEWDVHAMVALARRHRDANDRHATLKRELTTLYASSLVEHGVDKVPDKLALLAMDIELNAQGMGVWLDREAKAKAQ